MTLIKVLLIVSFLGLLGWGFRNRNHVGLRAGMRLAAIVMTGETRAQTVESIAAQGVYVLTKPFSAEELLEALRGPEERAITVNVSSR